MTDPTPMPDAADRPEPRSTALVPVDRPGRPYRRPSSLRQAVELALDAADALAERIRQALGAPERDRV